MRPYFLEIYELSKGTAEGVLAGIFSLFLKIFPFL